MASHRFSSGLIVGGKYVRCLAQLPFQTKGMDESFDEWSGFSEGIVGSDGDGV
jgi:hypothetical protein